MEAILVALVGAAATILAVYITIFVQKKRRKEAYNLIIKNT
jgi:hypothetical protein